MTLLLDSALRATVILTAGWLTVRLLRSSSADLRSTVWRLTLVAVAALPLLLLGVSAAPAIAAGITVLAIPAAVTPVVPAASDTPWLAVVWAAGFAAVLARLAAGLFVVGRWSRSAGRGAGASYSSHVSVPMTWGVVRPEILLPVHARDWPAPERNAAIAHEAAHIARRDWLWQMFARVVSAVFWFHPLVWVADLGLRREAEHAADDLVLRTGADPAVYAGQLLNVARHASRPVGAAVAMVRRSSIEDRLRHVLGANVSRSAAGPRTHAVAVALAAALVLSVAATNAAQLPRVGEDGITPPPRIYYVPPVYPEDAKAEKVTGTVFLRLELTEEGFPDNIEVLKSPDERLSYSAIGAVTQWRYQPALRDGEPVRIEMNITINYQLRD